MLSATPHEARVWLGLALRYLRGKPHQRNATQVVRLGRVSECAVSVLLLSHTASPQRRSTKTRIGARHAGQRRRSSWRAAAAATAAATAAAGSATGDAAANAVSAVIVACFVALPVAAVHRVAADGGFVGAQDCADVGGALLVRVGVRVALRERPCESLGGLWRCRRCLLCRSCCYRRRSTRS